MRQPQLNPPHPSAQREALVVADIAHHLERGEPLRIFGNVLAAAVIAVLFRASARPLWLAGWLALVLAHAALNAWAAWRAWRRPSRPENATRSLHVVTRMAAINGGLWMAAELLLLPDSDYAQRGLMMALLCGLGAGVMQSFSAHLPALFAFFVSPVIGFALAGFGTGLAYPEVALPLLLLWLAVNLYIARLMRRTLLDSLQNRHAAAALAADLQLQKDRAVELSQSRSRFLAAASHDLRQPVHALSLFVAALSQQPPADEAQRLLGHVRATVDSMGSLFNALLDMSKLDAALVQPAWQAVALQPLLARVAAEHSALAAAKGLGFAFDLQGPAGLAVYTDPVLLERILRNLLSNALRYTYCGQVRLQARLHGAAVRVRVADSGIGIPADRRDEVFQEFVRLRDTAPQAAHPPGFGAKPPASNPPDDREQGLGLGLAFVRRLCDLLGLPLVLRSRLGRGTVFSVRLPLAPAAAGKPSAAPAPDGLSAHAQPTETPALAQTQAQLAAGDVVLVLDDAADIRLAMSALLTGWGCQVLAADSLAGLMPQLMALAVLPRLIICDGRLQGGVSGLAVIDQLQADFNEPVPAILVTGDTAPERLRQAVASGLVLLHKPVVGQAALRDAISRALSAPPQAGVAAELNADNAGAAGKRGLTRQL